MHFTGGQARLADPIVKFARNFASGIFTGGLIAPWRTPRSSLVLPQGRRYKSRVSSVETLGFLMQTEAPKSKNSGVVSQNASSRPQSMLDNDEALAALHIAVKNHDFSAAEFIFDHTPSLHDSPVALELVVRNFCNMNDFTTAKAVLLQVEDKVNERGFIKFMIACFRHSENADDLQEVFDAAMRRFPANPSLVATALLGFKMLQDQPRIDAAISYAQKHKLAPTLPFMQVGVYDSYARGDYEAAAKLGEAIARRMRSQTRSELTLLRPDLPYRWALHLFAQEGNVEAIETLQAHMAKFGIAAGASFSNIVLANLPLLYPTLPLIEWLKRCKNWGWDLDRSCFHKLARVLAKRYPSQQVRIAHLEQSLGNTMPAASGHREQTAGGPELSAIRKFIKAGDPAKCLYVLDSMRRRGMVPPYYFHVLTFEALAKNGLKPELEQLVAKMKAIGYPRHCAGTDLAMLELQLREAAAGKNRSRSEKHADAQRGLLWVNQYLLEYPLIQHNLSQLTRIAKLFFHCRQPEIAGQVVDFLRWQSEANKFAAPNHDSRSLALLLTAEKQCGRSPETLLDTFFADRPRIFIDLKLKRRLRELLSPEKRAGYLEAVKRHNERVINDICQELNQLAEFVQQANKS